MNLYQYSFATSMQSNYTVSFTDNFIAKIIVPETQTVSGNCFTNASASLFFFSLYSFNYDELTLQVLLLFMLLCNLEERQQLHI